MARNIFYSFHFEDDFWRTQQVRNIGAIEGQSLANPNEWETIKQDAKRIEKWIDDSLEGKSCVVVLVGAETAKRKWVRREIEKGWEAKKGVVGIRINKLLDSSGKSSALGDNPFELVDDPKSKKKLSSMVKLMTPIGADSKETYAYIAKNIESWIEEAIKIRKDN